MNRGPVNSNSLKWSCGLHGTLLLLAVIIPLLPAFHRKELTVPEDFTVVLDENLIEPNVPDQPPEKATSEPQPAPQRPPEPEPEPDVPEPEPLPEAPRDALVIEKKKPPEKKKEPEKKPPEKKPEKPPEKKPVPFKKGQRVEAPKQTAQPKFEELYKPFDPSKPVSTKPLTDKMLSRGDIEKALLAGARAGTRNMIPEDEMSRCILLVKRAMYESWEQPGAGDSGSRPALLDIRLDATGRVVSYRIRQSSGSAFFDQTVLKAAANAAPIRGLSMAFLKEYETLSVEFKLE